MGSLTRSCARHANEAEGRTTQHTEVPTPGKTWQQSTRSVVVVLPARDMLSLQRRTPAAGRRRLGHVAQLGAVTPLEKKPRATP